VNASSSGIVIRVSGPMISCTSPPEQKLPPAPRITTALTSLADQAAKEVAQPAYESNVSGFFFSGRSSVIVATRASASTCQRKWVAP
jgi:hypothetical protein